MHRLHFPENSEPTDELVQEAIEYNESRKDKYKKLMSYYLGDHTSILDRQKAESLLSDNKVVVNHAKYITDINVGYLLGSPAEYQASDEVDITQLEEQFRKQHISDTDHELAKMAGIYGHSYEYIYTEGNDVKSKEIRPTQAIIVYDDSFEERKLFGVVYKKGGRNTFEKIMVLTKSQIIDFADAQGKIKRGEEQEHFFSEVPLVEFRNNAELQGDFEQIISLIDAINVLQSDRVNDKEQLVNSILAFYGFGITDELMKDVRDHRVLASLPKDGRAEYLTKVLSESQVQILKDSLEDDLHKISMTPNLNDEKFTSNASGVSIRYKLLAFEQQIKNKERYFEKALLDRFEIYNNYLVASVAMPKIEKYDVDVVFKRMLPQNDYEISQMINQLRSLISNETLAGQLSFVRNAREEIEQARSEEIERFNMEALNFGTDEPSE